ncbi:hypothetical protein [Streptomyces niphimycinicus]|uniref:hypothetical protein n=1 Tax=Streptomyces niphimycinicus TaxID=2842201 RepID=UPI001C0E5239|nr:hypothetical protein [Streptomyces niphimycinicus]
MRDHSGASDQAPSTVTRRAGRAARLRPARMGLLLSAIPASLVLAVYLCVAGDPAPWTGGPLEL